MPRASSQALQLCLPASGRPPGSAPPDLARAFRMHAPTICVLCLCVLPVCCPTRPCTGPSHACTDHMCAVLVCASCVLPHQLVCALCLRCLCVAACVRCEAPEQCMRLQSQKRGLQACKHACMHLFVLRAGSGAWTVQSGASSCLQEAQGRPPNPCVRRWVLACRWGGRGGAGYGQPSASCVIRKQAGMGSLACGHAILASVGWCK